MVKKELVERIEFLVEEPSMEAALVQLVPKLVGDVEFCVHVYRSKADLLKKLPARMKGYGKWLPTNWRIVVLVDRDDDDCVLLKSTLEQICLDAGLISKSAAATSNSYQVLNRIVIEELEAWYFGDWDAVRSAFPYVPDISRKAPYRVPDAIVGGTWERLEKILRRSGYFSTGLIKSEAATNICMRMNPDSNTSSSFRTFYSALTEMLA